MVIYSTKNVNECLQIINKHITHRERSFTFKHPDLLYHNEIIGGIKETKFWLEKTKPRFVFTISRAFEGKVERSGGGSKIVGKFTYPMLFKVIVLFILLIILISTGKKIEHQIDFETLFYWLLGPACYGIIIFVITLICRIIHIRDEQYIRQSLFEWFK